MCWLIFTQTCDFSIDNLQNILWTRNQRIVWCSDSCDYQTGLLIDVTHWPPSKHPTKGDKKAAINLTCLYSPSQTSFFFCVFGFFFFCCLFVFSLFYTFIGYLVMLLFFVFLRSLSYLFFVVWLRDGARFLLLDSFISDSLSEGPWAWIMKPTAEISIDWYNHPSEGQCSGRSSSSNRSRFFKPVPITRRGTGMHPAEVVNHCYYPLT